MKSLFFRVLALLMGSFLVVVAASYFLFVWVNHELHPGESRLHRDSLHIAQQLITALEKGVVGDARENLLRQSRMRSWILDRRNLPIVGPPLPPEIAQQLIQYPAVIHPRQNRAGRYFLFGHQIIDDGKTYRVVMATSRPAFLRGSRNRSMGVGIVAVFLGLLIASALLSHWILRPLRAFRQTVQTISADNLSARIPDTVTQRKDAFGELGREFNRMTTRVEQTMENQKQLFRDVSHELRSPLARIQVAASLSAQKYGEHSEAERIENEVERLDALIEDLLSLSRLQNQSSIARDAVAISSVLANVVEDANYEFLPLERKVVLDAPHPAVIKGDAAMLSRALENVIRNALRFSPDRDTVNVKVERKDEQVDITVTDRGPGIAEQYLDRIFDPFFRADQSRNSANGQHGIGLALTRTIIELHGGRISAHNGSSGGLVVSIQIPCSG